MPLFARPALRWFAVAALLALAAGLSAGELARRAVVEDVRAATLIDARLRAALFDSEVARFRLLPTALRDDRDVAAALADRPGARALLDRKFEALADATGASAIYLVGPAGFAIAASNWRRPYSFVGGDYRFRRYVRDALRLGSASQYARGTVSGRPGMFLSGRARDAGVIVVKLEFDALEAAWRRAPDATYVRDASGVVLVTSEPRWRFATTRALPAERLAALRREASLPVGALRPLGAMPRGVVERTVSTARGGWTLTLRRSAAASQAAARYAAVGTALAVAALATLAFMLRQRAVTTRRRTTELERAVAARTAALTMEMERRADTEARAASLREGLRQANRLATLGQVTASVAHETAQPVAAIRTYAHTSAALLDARDMDAVRDNLSAIARLADRIGAVTAQLRGFARRRAGELRPVLLAEVVDGALLILKDQLRGATLERGPIARDLAVLGGRVRLEQVLVNLIQNAIEALSGQAGGTIALTCEAGPDTVVLTVADDGPGVAPEIADRLFTPFVTSRAAGLGLGLVIAHDIMAELGGSLRLVPGERGARFDMTMRRA